MTKIKKSCYLMLTTMDEGVVFHLEGIDYTICTKDESLKEKSLSNY